MICEVVGDNEVDFSDQDIDQDKLNEAINTRPSFKRFYMNSLINKMRYTVRDFHNNLDYAIRDNECYSDFIIPFINVDKGFVKKYIEQKFESKMNWSNYGTYWCIGFYKPPLEVVNGVYISMSENFNRLNCLNLKPVTVKEFKKACTYSIILDMCSYYDLVLSFPDDEDN